MEYILKLTLAAMSSRVFTDIFQIAGVLGASGPLRGKDLNQMPTIQNGYLIVEDGEIADCGLMENCNYRGESLPHNTIVLPAWCDSHTHLVFAESRENEFVQKIKGASYAEIAAAGGGILNSAKKIEQYSEDQLFLLAWKRLEEIALLGTGAVEIKSGYGLSFDGELKMLKVIQRLKEKSNLIIKSTFLGAHAFPEEYRNNHGPYIQMLIHDLLPVIAREKLADYVDTFCEKGFFSPEEMETVCNAAAAFGLKPKLHVNQLNSIGAIQTGIRLDALSLDHLETVTDKDISDLGNFKGISTLLPSAAFFLRMNMPPARKLIESNAAVALATDYNPGSSPSGNMNFVVSLACIQMKMLPEEALNAATINGAFAMEIDKQAGSVSVSKKANLIFTKPIPSINYIPYSFGQNVIDKVMIKGEFI